LKKLIKIFLLILPLWGLGGISYAHIGSAGIVHEGKAGNYQVQVFVEPPDVIPGTAKVTVLTDGSDIQSVLAKPIFFWSGDEGSPRSDELLPVLNENGRFEGKIWLMANGSASVQIDIKGKRGAGKILIPIMATSTAQRQMPASIGWLLAGLALLLVGLLTTIIGASTGDSLLTPGQSVDKRISRRRWIGSSIGAFACVGILFIGNNWWDSWANEYKNENLYQPFQANSKITFENGQQMLHFQIDSNSAKNRSMSYLIPDHGKLMHLFLVRQGTMDAFAHLHPERVDSLNFKVNLPNLPAGKYLVYADVLRFHGLQYTIADTVEIAPKSPEGEFLKLNEKRVPPLGVRGLGLDDTYVITNPLNSSKPTVQDQTITICGEVGVKTALQDGSSIVWEGKPKEALKVGNIYNMTFSVLDPQGKSADLEPYLGMMGHAVVLKDDGSVYIHLHPNGTFSSTSVQVMQNRINETTREYKLPSQKVFRDSVDAIMTKINAMPEAERDKFLMPNMNHNADGHHSGSVSFPYSFPKEGNYRIWLQIKRNGKILTGAFDAKVI
jgi:hypothetical protein